MLSVEASKNVHAAVNYYLDNIVVDDGGGNYYSEKGTVIAEWNGEARTKLNIYGDVEADNFVKLLKNRHPDRGEKITPRDLPNRRSMYDVCNSPVKSVSIVYAITKDEQIKHAVMDANAKTMKMVEANIQTQVREKSGVKKYVTTGNMIYASYLHEQTRPTKKELQTGVKFIPDPGLHVHNPIPNMTWYEKEKRMRAIEIFGVKSQAPYLENCFHSYLANNLKKLGYELYKTENRWEIKGVSREVIEKYSNRSKQIEQQAEAKGVNDEKYAKFKAKLGRTTREDKDKAIPKDELQKEWRSRLTNTEYFNIVNAKKGGGKAVGQIDSSFKDKEDDRKKQTRPIPVQATMAVQKSMQHYMERNSSIQKSRVLNYALDIAGDKVSPEDVERSLNLRDDILTSKNKKGIEFITTYSMSEQEAYLIERTALSKAQSPALNPNYEVNGSHFTEGQKQAVNHVLNSNDDIIMVSGDAGTGKTTLLKEIKQGLRENNKNMFVFAPSSDAARNVLRGEGFENADTIAMLLANKKLQASTRGSVITIDEAGLVGVPTMNRIITIAEENNARLLLSGDWKQHNPIEAGDAQKLMEQKAGLKIARVNEIVRQRHVEAYKAVIAKMANGISKRSESARKEKMNEAFEDLDKQGNIIEIKNNNARHQRIAEDYLHYTKKKGDDTIIISPTRREGKTITNAVREKLREEGRIGKKDTSFNHLKSKQFTGVEKQLYKNYKEGDVIEFHQNATGFKAGLPYRVTGFDKDNNVILKGRGEQDTSLLSFKDHKRFDVFEQKQIDFARKDLLRITKNTRSLEGGKLSNGQVYAVKDFDWNGDIVLSNGATLSKNAQHFDHGYVTTSPASQSKTAKTSLIAQYSKSGDAAFDRQFYVSSSRGSENIKVYTDNKTDLKIAVTRNHDVMSATEIAENNKTHERMNFNMTLQQIEQSNNMLFEQEDMRREAYSQRQEKYEQSQLRQTEKELPEPEHG